jgi:hypothetical protein
MTKTKNNRVVVRNAQVPLARGGNLRCLNLIVERIPALMVFGFKYTVHADMISLMSGGPT